MAEPRWPPVCWVVSDGNLGMENQCVGLAEAMGLDPVVKRLKLPRFWREIGLYTGFVRRLALKHLGIGPPWPDLLIAVGRTSLLASLQVKAEAGSNVFVVQIQSPVVGHDRFDRVIVPEHDSFRGGNVLTMVGGLHRATPDKLREEAAKWLPRFAHVPRPYVALLLGGTNKWYRLGAAEIEDIGEKLAVIADSGAGLLITSSRRTGDANMARLTAILRDKKAMIWTGDGDNPYYGLLGAADSFIVTCDSVNMICEACSTGKPVQMIRLPGGSPKFDAFHQSLLASGRVRRFNGALERWQYEPLRDKERVAALIEQAYRAPR